MKPLPREQFIIYCLSGISVISAIILYSFCVSTYQGAQNNIKNLIDKKLPEITEEYRISYISFSGMPLTSSYSQNSFLPNPNQSIQILYDGGVYPLHDSINTKESFVQICNRMYYTLIFHTEPINEDTLLHIQSSILADIGFKGKSALLITTEKERRLFASNQDTSFIDHAIVSKPFITGLSDEVQFQLFAENSLKSIFSFAKPEKPLIVCILFFLGSVIALFGYCLKIIFFNKYRTGYGSLVLKEKERSITLNGDVLELYSQDYILLSLFIKDPEHSVTFHAMDKIFWSVKTDNTKRRQTLVSRVRMLLKPDTRFSLDMVQGDRYELSFNKKPIYETTI